MPEANHERAELRKGGYRGVLGLGANGAGLAAAVGIAVTVQNDRLRPLTAPVADPRLGSRRVVDKERHIGGAAGGGR